MRWAHAAALLVLLRIEYYIFHPSRAASSLLWGKHFPKGLIHEKKKAFCSTAWSCRQLRVLCIAVASGGNSQLPDGRPWCLGEGLGKAVCLARDGAPHHWDAGGKQCTLCMGLQ